MTLQILLTCASVLLVGFILASANPIAEKNEGERQVKVKTVGAAEANGIKYRDLKTLDITDNLPLVHADQFSWKDGQGNYRFGYDAGDHWRSEERSADGEVKGVYGYKSPDGNIFMTEFTAGKNGFLAETHSIPAAEETLTFKGGNHVHGSSVNGFDDNTLDNVEEKFNPLFQIRTSPLSANRQILLKSNHVPTPHAIKPIPVDDIQQTEVYGALRHTNKPMSEIGQVDEDRDAFVVEAPSDFSFVSAASPNQNILLKPNPVPTAVSLHDVNGDSTFDLFNQDLQNTFDNSLNLEEELMKTLKRAPYKVPGAMPIDISQWELVSAEKSLNPQRLNAVPAILVVDDPENSANSFDIIET